MVDVHEIWDKYDRSKEYMDKMGILTKTEKNWQMYIGKQWEAVEDSQGMENLPMFNIIKPTVKYKVSTIAQHKVTAIFSSMNPAEEGVLDGLNKLFEISWEKAKMDRVSWQTLKESAIQGDSYVYWGEGGDTRIKPQILKNVQVRLGDENVTDIQKQPWIIIEERLPIAVVREKARLHGVPAEKIKEIQTDAERQNMLYNDQEVSDKVTSLLYMEKNKEGIVCVARATREVMYENYRPVQQRLKGEYSKAGLTSYPIVSMVWDEVPNSARGIAEVEELIPNQLELNKTLARRSMSVKMTAYPKLAYDGASIENPEDLDKVGAAIKLNGGNAMAIGNMISYLAPQAMSGDAKQLSDELMENTRTLAGASDAQLGNIDLSRVSGTAAQTIRDQQQVPLNEQVAMYQDFVENVALVWFKLWQVYYPEGISWDGIEVFAEDIAAIEPNVRVDIAEDTTLSRMATQQELTSMFNNGKISFGEYADAYPEHAAIPKDLLQAIKRKRLEDMQMTGMPPMDEMGNPMDVPIDMQGNLDDAQTRQIGGMSGGSSQSFGGMQALQSQLAQNAPLVQE